MGKPRIPLAYTTDVLSLRGNGVFKRHYGKSVSKESQHLRPHRNMCSLGKACAPYLSFLRAHRLQGSGVLILSPPPSLSIHLSLCLSPLT